MDKNPSSQKGNAGNSSETSQESIYPLKHDANIADGGEFLDDGIRMKEQPYTGPAKEKDE
jgi:hypothetical protein